MPIFTIGHSTRPTEEFIGLLRQSGIGQVVDVRRIAGSNRHPQFNADSLIASLEAAGIGYEHAEGLTGRRRVSKTVPFEVNAWWQNRSFHSYADHALSEEFADALTDLRRMVDKQNVAVMCSEAVWWRCHRRIIADHLLAQDLTVKHILGEGHVDEAQLSEGAETGSSETGSSEGSTTVTYPSPASRA